MERIIEKIVGLRVPGVMLLVSMSMTGLYGAATITAGLTFLVAAVITAGLTEYGFDALFREVIKKLYAKGETKESLARKIKRGPWSRKLKAKALSDLRKLN
ncbi:hypothetical protein [uncultured Porphyromonas sp.]|uniref:hypothetical protein n=1 Tax=uncultured Porphyromonas sp. TaxID=159274 RepID=UPI002804D648|nr:hypothetical protein [uncultured Porphyromonas sp.]